MVDACSSRSREARRKERGKETGEWEAGNWEKGKSSMSNELWRVEWEKDQIQLEGGEMTERDAARDEPQQERHVIRRVRMRGSRGIKLLLLKEPFDFGYLDGYL